VSLRTDQLAWPTHYKLWKRMITYMLYEYAEVNSLLSTTQNGFRRQKDTVYQLQNVIMALEDAKLFGNNIYALIVDITFALNTADHNKMLMIMYDLGFPTDAIEIIKNLFEEVTQVKQPSCHSTNPIPFERGTIQGDSSDTVTFPLSPVHGAPLALVARWRTRLHALLHSKSGHGRHLRSQ